MPRAMGIARQGTWLRDIAEQNNHQSENRQDNGQCHEKYDQKQNPDLFVENLSGNITDCLALVLHGDTT